MGEAVPKKGRQSFYPHTRAIAQISSQPWGLGHGCLPAYIYASVRLTHVHPPSHTLTSVVLRLHGRAQAPIEKRGVGGRRNQEGTWRDHGTDVRRWDGGAGGAQEGGRDDAAAVGQQGTGKHGGTGE